MELIAIKRNVSIVGIFNISTAQLSKIVFIALSFCIEGLIVE